MLPAMPISVRYDPMQVVVSFERQGDDVLFRFRVATPGHGYVENLIDAYKLRETFLDVRTPGEAFDFLNFTGHFQHLREREEEQVHETLTWSDFQRWQEIVRILLRDGPLKLEEISSPGRRGVQFAVPEHLRTVVTFPKLSTRESGWLTGYPDRIMIQADGESPVSSGRQKLRAEIGADSTLEAILATAYIDGLRGINYQLCALSDCSTVYEVGSKHERQYCSNYCAHKASVRRRRAEAKALKESAKQKTRKTSSKKGNG